MAYGVHQYEVNFHKPIYPVWEKIFMESYLSYMEKKITQGAALLCADIALFYIVTKGHNHEADSWKPS